MTKPVPSFAMHSNCTNLRVIRRGHTTLNIVTGAMPEPQRFTWHLEPCNVPLFNRDHKEAGICRSCSKGWTHEHSYPADEAVYEVTDEDGETTSATIVEMYPDLDAPEAVLALAVGEKTTVGGGAAPLVTVRRLAYPELHTACGSSPRTPTESSGAETMNTVDLTATRINWNALTTREIEAIRIEAGQFGDSELARKARRAIIRRG